MRGCGIPDLQFGHGAGAGGGQFGQFGQLGQLLIGQFGQPHGSWAWLFVTNTKSNNDTTKTNFSIFPRFWWDYSLRYYRFYSGFNTANNS